MSIGGRNCGMHTVYRWLPSLELPNLALRLRCDGASRQAASRGWVGEQEGLFFPPTFQFPGSAVVAEPGNWKW
jgi:hypothetical protein